MAGLPIVSDIPTIIFVVDVTHPQPGKDNSLSIAAVSSVIYFDLFLIKIHVVASIDWPHIIQDLYSVNEDPNNGLVGGGMIREHFIAFRQETGRKPDGIIFYACQSLQEGYLPPLTFVVAQTGTVANTQFCHPREFNFHLNNHASIQFELLSFVNMPAHYNVLYDENKFSPN
ncbi:hypothetical protein DVH24_002926 [Malus domestica]|uniref:Piwi domain-containing protein n=1 Tax=Malus domestica TaxID=3750 RepID=A0A498K629_MALDO|nr:hypothetical protein DVH24_002926 [Malus domestica]